MNISIENKVGGKNMKKKSEEIKKLLVFFVLVIVVGFGANVKIFAEQNDDKMANHQEIVKEMKNLRTSNSTTYLLENGSRRIDIYDENIRFEKNGKLVEYNSCLNSLDKEDIADLKGNLENKDISQFSYANQEGDAKYFFPDNLSDETCILTKKKECYLKFYLQTSKNKNKSKKVDKKEIRDNMIVYQDKQKKIEYKYLSYPSYLKEEIVINKKIDTNKFSYFVDATNVILKKGNDGKIEVISKKDNNLVAYIDAPNIKSKDGDINYKDVRYCLKKKIRQHTKLN